MSKSGSLKRPPAVSLVIFIAAAASDVLPRRDLCSALAPFGQAKAALYPPALGSAALLIR